MGFEYPPQWIYVVIQTLQCLLFLAGLVAGILLLTRKRTLPGILALIAYFLSGAGVLVYIIIWYAILPNNGYTEGLAWSTLCLSTSLSVLGTVALVVFTYASLGKKEIPPLPPPPLDL